MKFIENFYLFGFLLYFQHCTGHITMVSFVGRGNQYIQLIKALYCKLQAIGKQLPTFPHKVQGLNCDFRGGRRVCYHCANVDPPFKVNSVGANV